MSSPCRRCVLLRAQRETFAKLVPTSRRNPGLLPEYSGLSLVLNMKGMLWALYPLIVGNSSVPAVSTRCNWKLRKTWLHCVVWTRSCGRSEEHTSELQPRENLVCRLLLEIKNTGLPVNQ